MVSGEVVERPLSKEQIIARFLALDADPRFRDFAGKIEINEYGDLLVNAASRLHVVVQKRLAAYLERRLGGEAIGEMPVEVKLQQGNAIRLRVPDIVWSAVPGFFDGPPELKVLPRPPELCVEVKSDSNTLKDMREKRDELLGMGAKEVWFIFPERRLVEFYGPEGKRDASQFGIDLTEFWSSY
jgi:Uma2 family endonuclease